MTLVVDASIAVKLYVEEAGSGDARSLFAASADMVAPELLLFEVTSALARKWRGHEITETQLRSASADLPFWFSRLWPMSDLFARAASLAVELNHSVYDCAYLALVEDTGFDFVTTDRRLRKVATHAGLRGVRGL